MPDENKQLNPQITVATIGRRDLREIEIYPLSVGDQLAMSSVLTEAVNIIVDGLNEDAEALGAGIAFILQNIPVVLGYVIDGDTENVDDLLKELTNEQAEKISEIVYEQNYKSLVKKVGGLFDKVKKQIQELKDLPSKRPLQPSASITDIDSEISTEPDLKTEASQ